MQLIYGFGIRLFALLLRIISPFNEKAKKWVNGRSNWRNQLTIKINEIDKDFIWVHCASLGEFEQARPILELIKLEKPALGILLSFFSPSGYEIQKDSKLADVVCYLPLDTKRNALDFIRIAKIKQAFFTKYEIWPNYLWALKKQNIPSVLFSAIFRENQIYFKPWGWFFRKALKSFDNIYVQNQVSQDLLKRINKKSIITGDTRFDRVWDIAQNADSIPAIESFVRDQKTIVMGSSWPSDEAFMAHTLEAFPNHKIIIAPHEIHEAHIGQIEQLFPNSLRYSQYSGESDLQVMIVDQIGLLSRIYQYAEVAIIGGGFGSGIHNTLEAVAYGCPVVFGPNFKKFQEAKDLIELDVAKSFVEKASLQSALEYSIKNRERIKKAALDYMSMNLGAAQKIIKSLV